jgi:hypothetical protein
VISAIVGSDSGWMARSYDQQEFELRGETRPKLGGTKPMNLTVLFPGSQVLLVILR